jgi:hypothetical protein
LVTRRLRTDETFSGTGSKSEAPWVTNGHCSDMFSIAQGPKAQVSAVFAKKRIWEKNHLTGDRQSVILMTDG